MIKVKNSLLTCSAGREFFMLSLHFHFLVEILVNILGSNYYERYDIVLLHGLAFDCCYNRIDTCINLACAIL